MATYVSSYLCPDSEILVGHKIRSDSILVSVCVWHEDVNVSQHDDGEGDKEGQVPPHLPTAIVVGMGSATVHGFRGGKCPSSNRAFHQHFGGGHIPNKPSQIALRLEYFL